MKRLLIWGTGYYARRFIKNGYHGEIVGFVETKKSQPVFMNKPVYGYDEIPQEYDYIVVANTYTNEIYALCMEQHIDTSRMLFLYGVKETKGCQDQSVIKRILSEENYTLYCAEYGLVSETFFQSDAAKYRQLNTRSTFDIEERYLWPVIKDKYAFAGYIGNYFWQDLWAARLIHRNGVKEHFDIGSRIDGFIAHLLAMEIDVTLIDIREFPNEVEKLHTIVDDATTLGQIEDSSIASMSALCSLEHFGLGRYGDTIDPEACFKCFHNIQEKLRGGGHLYLSVPIGREHMEFNAHRVFYANTIVREFAAMTLVEFSCTAEGTIEYNVDIHKYDNDQHNGNYRYGLFHFIKE